MCATSAEPGRNGKVKLAGLAQGLTTGEFLLYWSTLAALLFNTILLFWLALTILLNTERHTWGSLLASTGMLLGGIFFAAYTAGLDYVIEDLIRVIHRWWYPAWASVIALPFGWYVLMLWYTGFWDEHSAWRKRPRLYGFIAAGVLAVILTGLVLAINPRMVLDQIVHPEVPVEAMIYAPQKIIQLPLLVLIYPVYIVLCLVLSLSALRRPNSTGRWLRDVARRRARPWLIGSTLLQLVVSLLVGCMMLWVVAQARLTDITNSVGLIGFVTDWFEFLVLTLIASSNVLLGKVVMSYEIFTGKPLPRRGFLRQWRYIVLVTGLYSLMLGWTMMQAWRPIYGLLLSAILMSLFFAVLNWRSTVEREDTMAYLRPFVASQHLYDQLLVRQVSSDGQIDARTPFRALCADVLNASVAYLTASGPLAPLVGPPLVYPDDGVSAPPPLTELIPQLSSPQTVCIPLEAERYGGATWAVPLWSERGLIGVLLLGEKMDGGLYTQEEIEIARASGERLIDTQASAAMAQRLMALQRQRLAESQVIDRRARRTLHDEVLPRLHAAMLTLSGDQTAHAESLKQLADVHRQISDLLRDMPTATAPAVARLGLIGALRRAITEEFPGAFDGVEWQVEANAEEKAAELPSLTAEVVFYAAREAIRNAARYGRGGHLSDPLQLLIKVSVDIALRVVIEDDGGGMQQPEYSGDANESPESTPEYSGVDSKAASSGGAGHGLALHSTMMAVIGGALEMESVPGQFTRVVLSLPQGVGHEA